MLVIRRPWYNRFPAAQLTKINKFMIVAPRTSSWLHFHRRTRRCFTHPRRDLSVYLSNLITVIMKELPGMKDNKWKLFHLLLPQSPRCCQSFLFPQYLLHYEHISGSFRCHMLEVKHGGKEPRSARVISISFLGQNILTINALAPV